MVLRESHAANAARDVKAALGGLSGPKLTVTGYPVSRVLIENHRGLLEYTRELISVNGGKSTLLIHGTELSLLYMTVTEVMISGRLTAIELT